MFYNINCNLKVFAIILPLSLLSAILYRLGGIGKPFNTKIRDLGVPLVASITLYFLGVKFVWWAYLLHFALLFASLTTYWDELFGYDNFYAHGLFCGLSALPLLATGIPFWIIILRSIFLSIGMGLWSKFWKWDTMEEAGRGFLIPFTFLLS